MRNSRGQGDEFSVFFEKEYRSIVGTVMRVGASFEDAEDAVIEAMTIAAPRFHQLDVPGAWVRVVAMRIYIRTHRRDRERARREQSVAGSTEPTQLDDDGDLRRQVEAILSKLPPTQRIVLALIMDGYPCQEIATMLNSSTSTVRSNLRHARRAMAAGLKQAGWHIATSS